MSIKPLLIAASLIVIFLLEGVFPHYRRRIDRIKHGLPHVLTALINGLITRLLLAGLTMQVIARGTDTGIGLARLLPVPSCAKTAIAFALFDVWMYFWHRANHRVGLLWLFHRAHHSDTDMDTTTALRFHPGELILSTLFRIPAILLIGMSFAEVVLFETILNIATLFHHSNLHLPEKWDRMLRTVIVTPNMHRVHHSVERFETDSNYTSLLSIWDRLFRSFRMRDDTLTITLGLPRFREQRWQRFFGFLITPFSRS